jgi:hypothetical protein
MKNLIFRNIPVAININSIGPVTRHFSRQPGRGGRAKLEYRITLAAPEFVVKQLTYNDKK